MFKGVKKNLIKKNLILVFYTLETLKWDKIYNLMN